MVLKGRLRVIGNNIRTERGLLMGSNFVKKGLPDGTIQLSKSPYNASKAHRKQEVNLAFRRNNKERARLRKAVP